MSKGRYHKLQFPSILMILLIHLSLLTGCETNRQTRQDISLDHGWKSMAAENQNAFTGFEESGYNDEDWVTVEVPHNWDQYHGYLRKIHGNRHGYAWYRKEFTIPARGSTDRCFLWFEGVGSYATVWVNGEMAGYHAGGRTSFTLDITKFINSNGPNTLCVRADHPAFIRDLPWVCGGCSDEWGFSEGSQPMGIFRPVHLIITGDVRIEPFGVHLWNDTTVTEKQATIYYTTEIRNYSEDTRNIKLISTLYDQQGRKVARNESVHSLRAGEVYEVNGKPFEVQDPILWSPDHPHLYTLESEIINEGQRIDRLETSYGIRWISWPANRNDSTGRFLINGKPCFLNGIGEYEHQLGNSHAFTPEQIHTRIMQIRAAGFNAFRDAHQPHNLRYQQYLDELGMLWWPQMAAHIWFDNPAFRENFKVLLKDWVKERRNSPSVILWGLENESSLPTEFAEECAAIIRELDPTASSQRLITTCNGGTGTDWNVVQNWSGTYGGDPEEYDKELSRQLLNGEYGAWRSLDLHTEGAFDQEGPLSEDRMTQLLETKIHLAEKVADRCCGHFLWLFSSHDNPGRFQNGEGYREIDRIGPVNYKGLFTAWGEPTDAFYLYRSGYVPGEAEPMVYIVSHTWPGRWAEPGISDRIRIYSNCSEVELFNDYNAESLGKIENPGRGLPFTWKGIEIKYNILQAKGYINGKKVAEDLIVLNHLPEAPNFEKLKGNSGTLLQSERECNYLYRVNCGGNTYIDEQGNRWLADRHLTSDSTWGSTSWTDEFDRVPDFYASQRRSFDPVSGTNDWKLFQTFRYGREKLTFRFPLPDGKYRVELFFSEPWYGTGGGMDCTGWRQFDVAINGERVLEDFDIWKEAGHDRALKKVFQVNIKGGSLTIHFPRIISGQAVISAIAIASRDTSVRAAPPSRTNICDLKLEPDSLQDLYSIEMWPDRGDLQYTSGQLSFRQIPPILYGAEWIRTPPVSENKGSHLLSFTSTQASDVFIALNAATGKIPEWLADYNKTSMILLNDDPVQPDFVIYGKRIREHQEICLGGAGPENRGVNMYSVFVVPLSSLPASSDQRKEKKYASGEALLHGTGLKINVENGRKFILFTNPFRNRIEWKINPGLASDYEMALKYCNPAGVTLPVRIMLYSADGILLHSEILEFVPTRESWKTIRTRTGTAINAGNYSLLIEASGAKGLKIDYLTIR